MSEDKEGKKVIKESTKLPFEVKDLITKLCDQLMHAKPSKNGRLSKINIAFIKDVLLEHKNILVDPSIIAEFWLERKKRGHVPNLAIHKENDMIVKIAKKKKKALQSGLAQYYRELAEAREKIALQNVKNVKNLVDRELEIRIMYEPHKMTNEHLIKARKLYHDAQCLLEDKPTEIFKFDGHSEEDLLKELQSRTYAEKFDDESEGSESRGDNAGVEEKKG